MRRGRILFTPPRVRVLIHDQSLEANGNGTGPASTALYRLSNNGNVIDASNHALESWLMVGGGTAANFDGRATLISGSVNGTFGSWQSLTGSPAWSCTSSAIGAIQNGQIKVEIRDAATLAVLTSAIVDLYANYGGNL